MMKNIYPKLSLSEDSLIIELHPLKSFKWSNYLNILLDFDKETVTPSAIEIINFAGQLGLETINFKGIRLKKNDLHWDGYYDAEYDIFYLSFKKNLKTLLKTRSVKGRVSINLENAICSIEISDLGSSDAI